MSPTYELIDSITLSSDQSSISFDNIPQTYDDLMVVISARSSRSSATADGMAIKLNNSTSNFTNRILYADTGSVGSGSNTTSNIFDAPASSATANTFSNGVLYIPNYSSSQYKSLSGYGVNENNSTAAAIVRRSLLWSNTSAISSINIFSNTSSNFVTNSTFELYGIKNADDGSEGYFGPAARGGDEVYTTGDGYKVHVFKTSGTLEVTAPGEVEYLVVAGGGGAGSSTVNTNTSGGGGAGGFLTGTRFLPAGSYTVQSGAGGSGGASGASNPGSDGSVSMLHNILSYGGGGGGANLNRVGRNGGSGGGGGWATAGGSGISGQGNAGGTGGPDVSPYAGGGGGGAGSAGSAGSGTPNGGAGLSSSISGQSLFYSGGGAGGTWGTPATGGSGVGGNGASVQGTNPGNGMTNRGGGGGGTSQAGSAGGNGGSGIVIIRYRI